MACPTVRWSLRDRGPITFFYRAGAHCFSASSLERARFWSAVHNAFFHHQPYIRKAECSAWDHLPQRQGRRVSPPRFVQAVSPCSDLRIDRCRRAQRHYRVMPYSTISSSSRTGRHERRRPVAAAGDGDAGFQSALEGGARRLRRPMEWPCEGRGTCSWPRRRRVWGTGATRGCHQGGRLPRRQS